MLVAATPPSSLWSDAGGGVLVFVFWRNNFQAVDFISSKQNFISSNTNILTCAFHGTAMVQSTVSTRFKTRCHRLNFFSDFSCKRN